ncbi:MAG TPA: hypothetical protein VNI84_21525 [Pyrinomonadaceae bacterium]|nr:hypothetical protein [Pyrinomonadaceae bacterium]
MKKFLFVLISFATIFILTQSNVFACRCVTDPNQNLDQKINDDFETAKAVFSGKVIEVIPSRINQEILVKISVEESWKENLPEEITVATDNSSCGYRFEKGKSYLVFAKSFDEYNLSTSKCVGNRELTTATKELKILGKGRKDKIVCPTIMITDRMKGLPKDTWNFSAHVKNNDSNSLLTYLWEYKIGGNISGIKSGQYTSEITVENADLHSGIAIWLKISGLPTGCPNSQGLSIIE